MKVSSKKQESFGLYFTRAIVVALLGVVTYVTVAYCVHVYYDRESAFRGALACSMRVLEDHDIIFWLQNGTLLGSRRLGRLILWDADLDIGFKKIPNKGKTLTMLRELDSRCFGFTSSVRVGAQNQINIYRKCTKRICAEFHETVIENGIVTSGDGHSLEKELFPLEMCTVADVVARCPHNTPFYLMEAYGNEWLTRSLSKLFWG
ncbi:LicD family [Trypanosoma melophagium]|uniref:LicD family n=1 Tax=Trypanosoma melophagium TaxID=715481 RepID=UPI00351A0768|nr:LicD family [Trypanosoma melophagium]